LEGIALAVLTRNSEMKLNVLILILMVSDTCRAQNYDDSTGWIQPWLNSQTGIIQGMSVNLLDVQDGRPDTLFLAILASNPTRPGTFVSVKDDSLLRYRVLGEIECYAVKERSAALGQYWHIYDQLRRPIEFLLRRGIRIWQIQKTGEK
jgi:hypothetical protein